MPEPRALTVCRLVADDWQSYRAVRLAMLQESPSAFGSTHAQALLLDEPTWRQRLGDNVVLLARVGGTPVGSAMYSQHGVTDPSDCALYGMWVDPGCRGAGVGRALIEAVVGEAMAAGKRRIVLHVVANNKAAAGLYERAGFVATGCTRPCPLAEQIKETEMELVLGNRIGSAAWERIFGETRRGG